MKDLDAFFSSRGPLSRIISDYRPRGAQIEMAAAVSEALTREKPLIAEAGTGTGKTFAYLVPAIMSGRRIIVSTATKNLQDQLFKKDIPLIRRALNLPFTAAILKGRGNYCCLYRLHEACQSTLGFGRTEAAALAKIKTWSRRTRTGDIADMPAIAESDPVWHHATSTVDNCLGQDCPNHADCFLAKARKKAQEAEILIVNHHLLCADWSIRGGGFGELLPRADAVIIDEAHQLADVASRFLGLTLSGRQLGDLAQDTLAEFHKNAADLPALRTASEDLEQALKAARLAFGLEQRRGDWREIADNAGLLAELTGLRDKLAELASRLKPAAEKTKGLENCHRRGEALLETLELLLDTADTGWIRWFETQRKTFLLSRSPLDIAGAFQSLMQERPATWIFTSATLSVAGSFAHFAASLGLTGALEARWDSPFDYAAQSLFYHPRGLPLPDAHDFIARIVDFALPVLKASRGRAFFLFTSHRALQQAAPLLQAGLDFPLLIQGSRPKGLLLDRFKETENAVLLGTASFWEGVDVRGEALSCVIIEKLPFASPGDPILKARLALIKQQGRNPFLEYQVPAAVIALRQGIGRLIRDPGDRGVLMVCDRRLLKRGYGRQFLDSVPAMRRTRDLLEVENFFKEETLNETARC